MSPKETAAATFTGFEVLFAKMEDAKHADLVKASAEIAKLSEPIRALAEATAEIEKPRFTTFISST
jgi:hypothetical protein